MNHTVIWGAGDLGRSVKHILDVGGILTSCFVDDFKKGPFCELPVLTRQQLLTCYSPGECGIVVAIGYKHFTARQEAYSWIKEQGYSLANAVHPSAVIDSSAILGEGVVVFAGVCIDHYCRVSDNVLINTGTVIAHDTEIGSHSFIGPGVRVAGQVKVGQRAFIGVGATVINNVVLGDDSFIGGGTVVIQDVPAGQRQAGVPARPMKGDKNE